MPYRLILKSTKPIAKGSSAENPKSLDLSMAGACRNRPPAPHTVSPARSGTHRKDSKSILGLIISAYGFVDVKKAI